MDYFAAFCSSWNFQVFFPPFGAGLLLGAVILGAGVYLLREKRPPPTGFHLWVSGELREGIELYVQFGDDVRAEFRDRLHSRWAQRKRQVSAGILMAFIVVVLPLRLVRRRFKRRSPQGAVPLFPLDVLRRLEDHLELLLDNAQYAIVRPWLRGRVGAYVSRCREHQPRHLLACEPALMELVKLRRWRWSSLDHEIAHCIEDMMVDSLTYSNHGVFGLRTLAKWGCEMHAHLTGSPLVLLPGIVATLGLAGLALIYINNV